MADIHLYPNKGSGDKLTVVDVIAPIPALASETGKLLKETGPGQRFNRWARSNTTVASRLVIGRLRSIHCSSRLGSSTKYRDM